MSSTHRRGQGTARRHTARPLPTTVWLPTPDQPDTVPAPGAVLPNWAIEQIRTEFTHGPDEPPAALLKISIPDTGPGMDARARLVTYGNGAPSRMTMLLAEFHPDVLPAPIDNLAGGTADEMPGAMEEGWSGFFHRAHRLLPADGLLLLATRQRRDDGILTDPLGSLIACARTAGFRYLQHVIVAHAHPADDRLVPTPPADASPGVIHSDLIALTAIHHT
ncbi:hypothetical protein SLV14_002741 [Streptomyces sp. Je 1-4]|uniref:hypothetical protein n=1 Tax=Streptomyces TaxID=1883 RepID=UPI0021DA6E19|nr:MULTISPECIES: hypothetical protein [unclassified Streptomyces]UYB40153.1 hypothetical protein SLV14_002741 [Streptomyces sp. Je 1-4]UZQ36244.1 hypothetical protein SLV14N_002741 [Streptomyces sp. Je 1-4] [Streptomyces sp. Je 1-4 4N24]UZQ43662.1 hypothetical protein SLV14NA_002741 [Streptomyces sp. Je 1-4] [Streptomyces sp. Je 1-4 4N24_ara]